MLNLGHINRKQQYSNEGLGTIALVVVAVGIVLNIVLAIKSNARNKKDDEEFNKYLPVMKKHYPAICQYIKTELKNDPYFFTRKVSGMPNVQIVTKMLEERLSKIPKLMSIPVPTKTDTEHSYKLKINTYFSGKKQTMSGDMWGGNEDKYMPDDTIAHAGWLEANAVLHLLDLSDKCKIADNKLESRCDELFAATLSDGTKAGEVLTRYIGGEFYSEHNPDVTSKLEHLYGCENLAKCLFVISHHVKEYLDKTYGSEKIKRLAQVKS